MSRYCADVLCRTAPRRSARWLLGRLQQQGASCAAIRVAYLYNLTQNRRQREVRADNRAPKEYPGDVAKGRRQPVIRANPTWSIWKAARLTQPRQPRRNSNAQEGWYHLARRVFPEARHQYYSYSDLERSKDPLAAKGLMRHSSVDTTARHYIKDVPENTLKAMKQLETLCNDCATELGTKPAN